MTRAVDDRKRSPLLQAYPGLFADRRPASIETRGRVIDLVGKVSNIVHRAAQSRSHSVLSRVGPRAMVPSLAIVRSLTKFASLSRFGQSTPIRQGPDKARGTY